MNQKWEGNSPQVRFTYQDKSNYYQSPSRPSPHQLSQSSIPRPASLPQKTISSYRPEDTSHIKIIDDSFVKRKSRRHKIFEQSPLIGRKSNSKQRLRNQNQQVEFKTRSPQRTYQKLTQSLSVQTVEVVNKPQKPESIIKNSNYDESKTLDLDVKQLNQYIDKRLVQKLSQIDSIKGDRSMRQSVNKYQLKKKEQQIHYLKLEVQRLKRCERLNKQNQSLYTRLVGKMKQQTQNQTSTQRIVSTSKKVQSKANSPLKYDQNSTPINSLFDMRRLQSQKNQVYQQSHQKSHQIQQNIIVNKKINEVRTQPLKYALAPQQFLIQEKPEEYNRVKQSSMSKAITFNNSIQTSRGKSHSRRARMQVYPKLIQMQQQILNQESFYNLSQLPISNRLEEINNKLQRKMSRRSASKPHKDVSLSSTFYVNTASTLYRANPRYHKFMY